MLKYIKVVGHKGIKATSLTNLEHINVLCGKNNSGKSSILEALADPSKRKAGKKLDSEAIAVLEAGFTKLANGYSNPDPRISIKWFKQFIQGQVDAVVYEDEINLWGNHARANMKEDAGLRGHGSNTFNFDKLIGTLMQQESDQLKAVLIPSSRDLPAMDAVQNIATTNDPLGHKVLKRLFWLQNQTKSSVNSNCFLAIKRAFEDITKGVDFYIAIDQHHQISLQFSSDQKSWIAAEASGLGFRDILVMLQFILDTPESVILIEEPESHIHPEMQRRLLRFISSHKEKQFIIASHSNVLLDPTYVDRVFYVEQGNEGTKVVDETSRAATLNNLGYSIIDNLVSDLIVLTEGPYDIPILQELCEKLGFLGKYNLRFWPLGGDIMDDLDLSVFVEANKVLALVDSDPGSAHIRKRFVESCKQKVIHCKVLDRYAIENYFSMIAIRKIFPGNNISVTVTALDPKKKVSDQLGFSPKRMGRAIVREMSLSEFEGTDLLDFCKEIGKRLQ